MASYTSEKTALQGAMLDASKLAIGQRLASNTVIDIYPLGIWPAGTCGTVTGVETIDGQMVAHVRLDDEYACLAEWRNCLMAWEIGDEANSDATLASFDII